MKIKDFMKHINSRGNAAIIIKDQVKSHQEVISKADLQTGNYHGYDNYTFGQITPKNNTMYIYAYKR